MSRSRLFTFAPLTSLASLALLASACTTGASANDTSSSTSTSALSTDTNTTALAVGERVGITFSVTSAGAVTRVAIADPNDRGPDGRGHGGPDGHGGPGGPQDANRPSPLDANSAALRGRLHGAVSAVDLSTGKLTVLGVEALTDVNTVYGNVADLSQVQIGMVVAVLGTSASDGSFTAGRIDVRPDDMQGVITAISSDTPPAITVLGRVLALDANTQVVQLTAPQRNDHGGPGDPNHGGGRPPQR